MEAESLPQCNPVLLCDLVRSYSVSYGWRSITSVRPLVKKGLIKRVGTRSLFQYGTTHGYQPIARDQQLKKPSSNHTLVTVNQLIDQQQQVWNKQLIEEVMEPEDVALILSVAFNRFNRSDSLGWAHTKTGKYTVKSGYQLERTKDEEMVLILEPSIKRLQAHYWKIKCPPKIRHFIWQDLSGCLPVTKNLKGRGIKCDTRCVRCGVDDESINHVLFECPPAIQTWALSHIPTNPDYFPITSLYMNMDYLFWRKPADERMNIFPWLLWYIWKSRNDMVYKHIDRGPQETLRLAETEFVTWGDAHMAEVNDQPIETRDGQPSHIQLTLNGRWCFVDGSWKEGDQWSGQGWYSRFERDENVWMGAMNIRASISPLHAEFEALVWAMECMKCQQHTHITFATDCSELVKIVSEPEEWPAFSNHIEEFQVRRESFIVFKLIHIPRTSNLMADRLARSARLRPSHTVHVGSEPPIWINDN